MIRIIIDAVALACSIAMATSSARDNKWDVSLPWALLAISYAGDILTQAERKLNA